MIRHGEVYGLGVMTWIAYVLQPISWLYIYCLVEGVIRTLDAALNERNLGVVFLYLPFKVGGRVRRVYRDRKKRAVFGPPRPDEVCLSKDAPSSSLEIYSFEEKPWFARQVVRYQDELWILQSKDLTLRGKYHWHHYRFRRMAPSEIARGEVTQIERSV